MDTDPPTSGSCSQLWPYIVITIWTLGSHPEILIRLALVQALVPHVTGKSFALTPTARMQEAEAREDGEEMSGLGRVGGQVAGGREGADDGGRGPVVLPAPVLPIGSESESESSELGF